MILIQAALALLAMIIIGLALFRRLAHALPQRGLLPAEEDLLLIGILPAIALIGTLSTYLSLAHLLRGPVVALLGAALLVLLRKDLAEIFHVLGRSLTAVLTSIRRGNLLGPAVVALSLWGLAIVLRLSIVPSENVDVWAFHMPIARSYVESGGFRYPQIDHQFYGNQPLFFELLYGTVMLFAPHFVAANMVNIAVYVGLVLLLLTFARKEDRALHGLVLWVVFFWKADFIQTAVEPMIDLPRSCFSVGAYLFAYRYACHFRRLDLCASALLVGAAISGKYTELVTALLIGLVLVPLMLRRRETWSDIIPAAAVLIGIAGFWYVKNAIRFGNPIYPFLLGHPGLTDEWMAQYFQDLGRPFEVADRIYSTNLLTLKGWHDFAVVLAAKFRWLLWPLIVALIGLPLSGKHRWILPLWVTLLFLFWYTVMFNGTRWAMPAVLLLLSLSFFSWMRIVDWARDVWTTRNNDLPLLKGRAQRLALRTLLQTGGGVILALALLVNCIQLVANIERPIFYPRWINPDMGKVLFSNSAFDRYLKKTRWGYAVYRYVGEHNLVMVLQPFDSGAIYYVSAYNGGLPNRWILPSSTLPPDTASLDFFLRKNDVHYFIYQRNLPPEDLDRLGSAHMQMANAAMAGMMKHAHLLMADGKGMELYALNSKASDAR